MLLQPEYRNRTGELGTYTQAKHTFGAFGETLKQSKMEYPTKQTPDVAARARLR